MPKDDEIIPGLSTAEERERVHTIAADMMVLALSMHDQKPLPALASLMLAAAGAAASTQYSIPEMVELFQSYLEIQRAQDQLLFQNKPDGVN